MNIKILYVFPHPDDESFGPASAMAKQVEEGHEVFLLTLTRGEATRVREKLGVSKSQMGVIRSRELANAAQTIGLAGLTILDFPDSELKEVDPRQLESAVSEHITQLNPRIIVTYPVHGISGFHDHLVTHAVVKRVFVEHKGGRPMRLAFFTLSSKHIESHQGIHQLNASSNAEIDCIVPIASHHASVMQKALDCYETYREVIVASGIKDFAHKDVCFEFYNESFSPPLADLGACLPPE